MPVLKFKQVVKSNPCARLGCRPVGFVPKVTNTVSLVKENVYSCGRHKYLPGFAEKNVVYGILVRFISPSHQLSADSVFPGEYGRV